MIHPPAWLALKAPYNRLLQGGSRRLLLLAAVLLLSCGPKPQPKPNILLIVVDTLRYDHLSFYGYGRQTSPAVEAQLANRGVVFEDAYAQAPWTLPSVASLLTGLPPEELLDPEGNPSGLPQAAETLAEGLTKIGYQSAAFIANPTVHAGNGFAQGFGEFNTAPYELASMHRHSDEVNSRAIPWLAKQGKEPFFVYLHYLDPHDPYDNPEMPEGRTIFDPGYTGTVRGSDVHGLYLGALQLADADSDLTHLNALYDGEILYVDRYIDELLASIEPEVLRNTLVVLTSDHGEEFLDHGGWKHGETLYEELIHVPLVVRWDREIAAGRRLPGTVSLLDLKPTLLAAAGAPPKEGGHGRNLLPALTGKKPLVERASLARHLSGGPLRISWTLGRKKVILFDREESWQPQDDRQARLWKRDYARLKRLEVYDLQVDPMEQENLAGSLPDLASIGQQAMLTDLDRHWSGLRIMATGLPPKSVLQGELQVDGEIEKVRALFLAAEDYVHLEAGRLQFRLTGDGVDKGMLLGGPIRAIDGLRIELDGLPGLELVAGSHGQGLPRWLTAPVGAIAGPWPIALRSLLVTEPPLVEQGPALKLWIRRPEAKLQAPARDEETIRRLRNLGYLD